MCRFTTILVSHTCATTPLVTTQTLGVQHIGRFDFIDVPSPAALKRALQHLVILGALHQRDGTLTKRGRRMSALPLVPL